MTRALEELRDVDIASVYKGGRLAARLTRARDAIVFDYLDDYRASGGRPVATTLPLSAVSTRTHTAGALPPFFAGLLPEGRRLSALRRAIKTSADDELTLLLAVGGDTIGDVQVVPEGAPPLETEPHLEVTAWSELRFADLFAGESGERIDRVALPGVQDKVSARMLTLPVARRQERYILKLSPPEYPFLVENEAFFLRAARASGLGAAEPEVVHDADGRAGLLVRRFDRVPRDNGIGLLAQEDACQVLGLYPADKYRVTTEDVVTALADVCLARPVAARELLRQLAFAFLTCNGDAHAKNFSVLEHNGEWRVSPLYDAPSSHPYGDTTTALSLAGKRREDIGRKHFVELGALVGVPERAVNKALDELVERAELWLPRLEELPFDESRVHRLRRAVEYRRTRLAARVG